MNIHEYQAKELFRTYSVPVMDGIVADTPQQAAEAVEKLGGDLWVVKAQIHAGGRGKAGGVKLVKSAQQAHDAAKELLGKKLYTKQTGPSGKTVNRVLVEKGSDIVKEYYLAFTIDFVSECVVLVASGEGGMDIEDVAANRPESIIKVKIDPAFGLHLYQCYFVADNIGIPDAQKKQFASLVSNLYKLFVGKDCALVEINPLALNGEGNLVAVDAKVDFDSSGLFRHPELEELRDRSEETELEAQAFDLELNYVSLEGNIGCYVIGAGLAMATMDSIKYYGGEPANFLDCGGANTSPEVTRKAFKLVLNEHGVEGVLINIFGGIVQTDLVARGVIDALKDVNNTKPIVARIEGFNADIANKMLEDSGLGIHLVGTLTEGVKKIMSLVGKGEE